jgi:glycosyltransferase involved in cell wall biosynthesis
MAAVNPRLVMVGAAPETRGSIAAVVEAYRAQGLFKRWPIDYLATHGDRGARGNAKLLLGALRWFAGLVVRERAVAVHLHTAPDRGLWRDALFIALAFAARWPVILQLHGNGLQRLHDEGPGALRALIRFALEKAACVVVACESQRTWLRGVTPRAQVAVVPNPVAPVAALPEAQRASVVLFLGRLEPAKGVFDLLEALSALRPAVPDIRLLCAGEGDRGAVRRHAERLGMADAVTFTGWVGPSGKRALFENAAVFALPSYDEAMPMSLLEAMAAGMPAIATPVGGVPEVMADGVSGFFVAPGDTATLQRLLRKLLLDNELAARIGIAAREAVRLRCAPERAVPRLEKVYAAVGLCTLDAGQAPLRHVGIKSAG